MCKCCGKYELDSNSLFQVCPICGWESDPVQENEPNYSGGANEKSLNEYKKEWEYKLINKITKKDIDNYNEYYKLLKNDIYNIKELDRIKTKDGRIGTVMGIWFDSTGLEVEFDDNAPKTETIDIKDVKEILKDAE